MGTDKQIKNKRKIKLHKEDGMGRIKSALYLKYRDIYIEFLNGVSRSDLAEKYGYSPATIDMIISKMNKYTGFSFDDEEKLTQAINKVRLRKQKLIEISDLAEKQGDLKLSLYAQKELRKNDELEFKLMGLLKSSSFEPVSVDNKIIVVQNIRDNQND